MRRASQSQVRWVGVYSATHEGRLYKTTSSFTTTQGMTGVEAFKLLEPRGAWLPWDGRLREHRAADVLDAAYGRPARGGWTLQHVYAEPHTAQVCVTCTQECCNGRCSH